MVFFSYHSVLVVSSVVVVVVVVAAVASAAVASVYMSVCVCVYVCASVCVGRGWLLWFVLLRVSMQGILFSFYYFWVCGSEQQ